MSQPIVEHAPHAEAANAAGPGCTYRDGVPGAETPILYRNLHGVETHIGEAYFNTHFGQPVERDPDAQRPYVREHQTHFDKAKVLSGLISSAAIHFAEHGSRPKDLYLAAGDGTTGLFVGILSNIVEQAENAELGAFTWQEPEPIYKGDFSKMTKAEKIAAQNADILNHKDDLQETIDRLHESVVNEALLALAGIRLVLIPAGNGCDAASEYQDLKRPIPAPEDWTETRLAYPVRITITPPDGSTSEIYIINYWGVGADGEVAKYLADNRQNWQQMGRVGRLRRELTKSLSSLRSTRVTVDNKELASFAIINGSRFAKLISTEQNHSSPNFDIVREPVKNNLADTIWSGLKLVTKRVKGTRQSEIKFTINSDGSPHHDGDRSKRLQKGTIVTAVSSNYPVRIAAAP